MKVWEGNKKAQDLRFGVIVSRWNGFVTESLLEGALETLKAHGVKDERIEVMRIPGCFEMPLATERMAVNKSFDALICLGAIIRGETTHHEHIAREASAGIQRISQQYQIPIGFGILTTENSSQAMDRAGRQGKGGNKGAEAALAALEMASLFRDFEKRDKF